MRAYGNAPCETPGVDYGHDFIIEIPKDVQGLVNLGGIESPGLTAAPAIALRIIDLLKDAGEKLVEKQDWNPVRVRRPRFRHLSMQERAELIRKDERYGRVVCRCETVTEGEIVAEIHAPLPARTYDAIKRRTWLGTGRCLGGFDLPRVVDILARELEVSPLEVSKKGPGSEFLSGTTKPGMFGGRAEMTIKDLYDVVVIGAGPGGLAAAISAKKNGAGDVLIIERDLEPGGILLQCIHNGFGLEIFKQDLPGPSYAQKFINEALTSRCGSAAGYDGAGYHP